VVDFKYHVVSIVAVFLALAVGIVLGTNVLSGDVLKNLKTQTSQLRKEAQDLRAQNGQQQAQVANDEAFANALEPMTVAGRLTGKTVIVVMLPDAQKSVRDQSVKTLTDAGAIVGGEVDINSSYLDPQQTATLGELVTSLASPADTDPTLDAPGRAAAVLAAALVSHTSAAPVSGETNQAVASDVALILASPSTGSTASSTASSATKSPKSTKSPARSSPSGPDSSRPSLLPTPGVTLEPTPSPTTQLDAASTEVLAGLEKAGFIKVQKTPAQHASIALIVAASPPDKPVPDAAATTDKELLELAAAFPAAGSRTVVAGATGSAAPGGLVAALRGNGSVGKTVTSVDDSDHASGRIAIVYAFQWLDIGQAGHFGTGPGAQAPLPTESPSASPSPSPSLS
jgi:Copper transport outer membrane protein, MctB